MPEDCILNVVDAYYAYADERDWLRWQVVMNDDNTFHCRLEIDGYDDPALREVIKSDFYYIGVEHGLHTRDLPRVFNTLRETLEDNGEA